MEKRITLSRKDIQLLNDVLEYILFQDGKELEDLCTQMDCEVNDIFDEYDNVDLNKIPNEFNDHIFVKAVKLHYELKQSENQ